MERPSAAAIPPSGPAPGNRSAMISQSHSARAGPATINCSGDNRRKVASCRRQSGSPSISSSALSHPIRDEFPPAKWHAILDINLSAAFHGIAAAVPQMKKQRWGRIVNIASTHGLVGSTHKAAYVAAKHGLIGLTKVVGLETAGSGVTCNAICPGWVRTPLVEKQISDLAAQKNISQQDAAKALLGEKQPSSEFVSPEQLGATVAFLCSPAADQITGTAIAVDGGWTAQ